MITRSVMNLYFLINFLVIFRFLTEGGLMILATWLGEAAKEEQTTFLDTLLKVLITDPLFLTFLL